MTIEMYLCFKRRCYTDRNQGESHEHHEIVNDAKAYILISLVVFAVAAASFAL